MRTLATRLWTYGLPIGAAVIAIALIFGTCSPQLPTMPTVTVPDSLLPEGSDIECHRQTIDIPVQGFDEPWTITVIVCRRLDR